MIPSNVFFVFFTLAKQKCVMFACYQMHKLAEAKQVSYVCKKKQQHKNINSICIHITYINSVSDSLFVMPVLGSALCLNVTKQDRIRDQNLVLFHSSDILERSAVSNGLVKTVLCMMLIQNVWTEAKYILVYQKGHILHTKGIAIGLAQHIRYLMRHSKKYCLLCCWTNIASSSEGTFLSYVIVRSHLGWYSTLILYALLLKLITHATVIECHIIHLFYCY